MVQTTDGPAAATIINYDLSGSLRITFTYGHPSNAQYHVMPRYSNPNASIDAELRSSFVKLEVGDTNNKRDGIIAA